MNFMEQNIQDTFQKMLKERPFSEISVSELAKVCGINRKTFYYYYEDIFALARSYFSNVVSGIIDQYPVTGSQWIEGMKALLEYFKAHKVIAMNMYRSLDYKLFEEVLYNSLVEYSRVYIENKSSGTGLAEEDIQYISQFITIGITGSILQWVKDGMKGEISSVIDRYEKLFGASLKFIAANAASLIDQGI